MRTATTPLSPKESRFVAEYLVDGNGTRAAIAAGYAEAGARVTACRLVAKANVQKALQARQQADAARLSLEREDVIQGLLGAVQQANERQDPGLAISGWREIARMLGFYAPDVKRVQVAADRGVDAELRRYEAMTDEELRRLVAGGAVAPRP